MGLIFELIHSTVIDALKLDNAQSSKLEIIGKWYFKFLISHRIEIKLTFPFYDKDFVVSSFQYLRFFSIIYELTNSQKVDNFSGLCIFDIFNYNPQKVDADINKYLLKYTSTKNDLLKFGEDVITVKNKFLPVFSINDIQNKEQLDVIYNSFVLFKSIRKKQLVNCPVFIDLKKWTLTLCSESNFTLVPLISIYDEQHKSSDSQEGLADKAENINSMNIIRQLLVRYPYHREILSWLIVDNVKKVELCLNSRFFYEFNDLSDNDLVLLPNEICKNNSPNIINPYKDYNIYNSKHSLEIYNLFKKLNTEWKDYEFNRFTTPFPKYWFMFINPIIKVNDWIELFEENFPEVSQKPIIHTINELIREIHKLDWIGNFIKNNNLKCYSFIFTEIKGNRIKKYKDVLRYFKDYVSSINNNICLVSDIKESKTYNNYILNGFDLIDLVNFIQHTHTKHYNFLFPDFIYYLYNPWVSYQLYNYQKQPLTNSIRLELNDENTNEEIKSFEKTSTDIRTAIKTDINNYHKHYVNEAKFENEIEDIIKLEDIKLNNDEENLLYTRNTSQVNDGKIIIYTKRNEQIPLLCSNKVYVYRNSLTRINAKYLIHGDLFFTNADIYKLLDKNNVFDKLSEIPQNVLNFQFQLHCIPNAYSKLNKLGLSYSTGETYFNSTYCLAADKLNNQSFKLPRKWKFWVIICEFLNIDFNEMNLAFISYYGATKRNQIKQLYKKVFNYLIENNSFGMIDNPKIKYDVEQIVSEYKDIFEQVKDFDLTESILNSISNELLSVINEVESIKLINNESV